MMIIRIIQSLKRLSLTGFSLGYTSYDIGAIRRNYTHKYVTWRVLDPAGNCLQLCSFILKIYGICALSLCFASFWEPYQRRQWHPLRYSCLENPTDGGAWWATVHGVARSQTRRSDFTFTFHFHALEKEMATHSSVLAWRIPGTGEPGGLPSMGSHRVGHDWSDLAAAESLMGNQPTWMNLGMASCGQRFLHHCFPPYGPPWPSGALLPEPKASVGLWFCYIIHPLLSTPGKQLQHKPGVPAGITWLRRLYLNKDQPLSFIKPHFCSIS